MRISEVFPRYGVNSSTIIFASPGCIFARNWLILFDENIGLVLEIEKWIHWIGKLIEFPSPINNFVDVSLLRVAASDKTLLCSPYVPHRCRESNDNRLWTTTIKCLNTKNWKQLLCLWCLNGVKFTSHHCLWWTWMRRMIKLSSD